MSRRSAGATETGTTAATFARAEAGLGSPPPHPDPNTLSQRIRMIKEFPGVKSRRTGLIEGRDDAGFCSASAVSGLPIAIVIRRPLSDKTSVLSRKFVYKPRAIGNGARLQPRNYFLENRGFSPRVTKLSVIPPVIIYRRIVDSELWEEVTIFAILLFRPTFGRSNSSSGCGILRSGRTQSVVHHFQAKLILSSNKTST